MIRDETKQVRDETKQVRKKTLERLLDTLKRAESNMHRDIYNAPAFGKKIAPFVQLDAQLLASKLTDIGEHMTCF